MSLQKNLLGDLYEGIIRGIGYVLRQLFPVRPLYPQHDFAEKHFNGHTTAGFTVPLRLTCTIDVIDDSTFIAHHMYEADRRSKLADEYLRDVAIPYLQQSGFFTFSVNRAERDDRVLYSVTPLYYRQNSQGELDRNIPIDDLKEIEYKKRGCRVQLSYIYIKSTHAKEIVMENYNKIGWDEREKILANPRYREYEECLAVTVQRREMELIAELFPDTFSHKYAGEGYNISVEGVGTAVKIAWSFYSYESDRTKWSLLGFRKEGGFSSDKWSESENGALVIDSSSDSMTIEQLKYGQMYYYTFFLKHATGKSGNVRFSLRVPTERESEMARYKIEKLGAHLRGENSDAYKLREMLEKMDSRDGMLSAIRNYRLQKNCFH